MEKNETLVIVVAFLLAAVWFFVPVGKPEGESLLFVMRLALPAVILTLGGIRLLPWLMTLAFCFCAIGDAMGVWGSFEGQMGGFAIAHICFISWFIREIRHSKPRPMMMAITTLFCVLPLMVAAWKVIPVIHFLPIRIGCIVYALLLAGTMWTAIVRAFSVRNNRMAFVAALGGMLFLISDFVLSWNKFTEHIPHASLYIMTTYYAALLFLFIGCRPRPDAQHAL